MQLSENVLVLLSGPVDSLPDVAFEPLQPPDAVHEVASVVDHVSMLVPLTETAAGLAARVKVGTGGGGGVPFTVTVAVCCAVPPLPLQLNANVLLVESGPTFCVPEGAFWPLQAPEAVHDVALVLDQVSVLVPPDCTLVGLAVRVTVGAGGCAPLTVTVTDRCVEPPVPLQLKV